MLQAGTNYGYGTLGWAVFSTLHRMEDGFVLKQRMKTPNALTLTWPSQWLPSPTSRFTVGGFSEDIGAIYSRCMRQSRIRRMHPFAKIFYEDRSTRHAYSE